MPPTEPEVVVFALAVFCLVIGSGGYVMERNGDKWLWKLTCLRFRWILGFSPSDANANHKAELVINSLVRAQRRHKSRGNEKASRRLEKRLQATKRALNAANIAL